MNKLIAVFIFIVVFYPLGNTHAFDFFDGRLYLRGNIHETLNIRTHEDFRDIRYSSFRTTLRLESIFKITSRPGLDVRIHALGKYYYDKALDLDSQQRHAVREEAGGRHKYRDFRRPRDMDEWLSELYLDVKWETFQIRAGKQIVSWGETAEDRVADLINPLDTKYMLGYPDWEDFKLGLWMARLFWTPKDIWQDLSFELIVIPFHFLPQRLPPGGAGLFIGQPLIPNAGYQKMFDKQRRDEPPTNLKNFEIGLRIRGYADILEGIDWAVSHFYTRTDSGLIDGDGGFGNYVNMMLGLPMKGDVYKYPFYNSTAFTFSTTWSRIKAGIRGEVAYNSNKDYQFGNFGEIKECDLLTTALTIDKSVMVPYLSRWNKNRSYYFSLTGYQYWLTNHEYNKSTGSYIYWESGKRDSSWTKFSLVVATGFWFDRIIVGGYYTYDLNGNTYVSNYVLFQPGDHWQYLAKYQQVNESGAGRYSDQVVLSIRYEFW